jgi:hypothetical protein
MGSTSSRHRTPDAADCRTPINFLGAEAFATAAQRVVATFDTDYLALHQTGIQHAGIAWCQERKYSIGPLIQALLLVHGILDSDRMQNHVEYL